MTNGKKMPMITSFGEGKEICDMLRDRFGLPKHTRWFEVRFESDDVVKVTCEYFPETDVPPYHEMCKRQ